MGKVSYSLEPRREAAEQPRQTPRPGNLPRTIDPAMLFSPVVFGVAIFTMGFATGAMWMGWLSR